jgi:hypothetical protein
VQTGRELSRSKAGGVAELTSVLSAFDHSQPSVSTVLHPWSQPAVDQKHSSLKIAPVLSMHGLSPYYSLHNTFVTNIYIESDIISNLE